MSRADELALANKAKRCWSTAGQRNALGPAEHCCVSEVEGRLFWWFDFPGDSMTFSGITIPMSTTLTPCDEHLPEFERMWP